MSGKAASTPLSGRRATVVVGVCGVALLLAGYCDAQGPSLLPRAIAGAQADFYVSTNGNDAWSGRLPEANDTRTDGPFATLARARDAVRQARSREALPRPITVLIRAGVYRLSETVVFTPDDSGTKDARVTWRACPGEDVVLFGGRRSSGIGSSR